MILTNSTLSDEFMSNYKRVVVLSSHEDFDDKKYAELNCGKIRNNNYEYQIFKEMLPKNFSWTFNLNEKNIFTVLNNTITCDDLKWKEHVNQYRDQYLYDQNNKIFLNQLKIMGIKTKLIE